MHLSQQLEIVEKRLDSLLVSFQNKEELRALSQFLHQQSRCDMDRRAKAEDIQEAATRYVQILYQVCLQASLQQKQEFWDQLERVCGKRLEVTVRPRTEVPVGSESWDVKELFEYLISQCEKLPFSPERTPCVQGLIDLLAESRKVRYQRNTKTCNQIWRTRVYPYLEKQNFLSPFRSNVNLKGRLKFFLTGTY